MKRECAHNAREAPSMWSDRLKEMTRDVVSDFRFVPNSDVVYFKNINSRYGYISVSDIMNRKLLLVDRESSEQKLYVSVDQLLNDGWVVD